MKKQGLGLKQNEDSYKDLPYFDCCSFERGRALFLMKSHSSKCWMKDEKIRSFERRFIFQFVHPVYNIVKIP